MDRRWAEAHWVWANKRARLGDFTLWLRPNNIANLKKMPDWQPDWERVLQCNHKHHWMSDESGRLDGTNSGGVALNLAYSMRPKRPSLFGFDYQPAQNGEAHWFAKGRTGLVGDYPIHVPRYRGWGWQFNDVAHQFKSKGIDVANVSATTVVQAFRKIAPADFMKGVR